MNLSHYFFLYPSYAIAIFGWILYTKRIKSTNEYDTEDTSVSLRNPKIEFGYAILSVIGILLLGQLFVNDLLLEGNFIVDAINQIIIFSPVFLLLVFRKNSLETALIPQKGKLMSLVVGFILAIIALMVFQLLKGYDFAEIGRSLSFIYLNVENLDELVQVFAEDFVISVLLFRLVSWCGLKKSTFIVAFLFAAGHIPAMISNGVSMENFLGLLFDFLLGVLILQTVYRSKNFLWFWMIHFAMDMTQFLS